MRKGRVWILTLLALCLFALDVSTKYWVQHHLIGMQHASPFYPYGGIGVFKDFLGIDFCINLVSNKGGAWGIFSSYPMILLSVRIGIILVLAIYTFFVNKLRRRTIPFLMILVGAAANIVDYFVYGAVVDMFHFVFWNYSYPVFNVADMLIFFGVATLLVQTLIEKVKRDPNHAAQPSKS
ncbi:signal peptidase II [Candidatus Neptunichlamydia sp. REUL1]|uniref:signal peptidase II n=1 Tax=Candidatus Neptunichlamydia sp. REUL1 TaxID=3064277 RepID=UPI00292CDF3C|nr:signal peptidase II [Candidatus Neptunochlamydia sp. REUL1]